MVYPSPAPSQPPQKSGKKFAVSLPVLTVVASALAGGIVAAIVALVVAGNATPKPVAPAGPVPLAADWSRTAAEVAAPSVVTIIAGAELVDPGTGYATSAPDSTGSGVIVSEDGY